MVLRRLAKTSFAIADVLRGQFAGPRILIYHQIGAGHGREMDVRSDCFVRQLDWLEETHREVVSIDEAIKRRGESGSDNLVVITFDDGYADMHKNGFGILRDRHLPFTMYITTAPIETRLGLSAERESTPLTWDQINEMAFQDLMTIAAHTHTHTDLRMIDADRIEQDLAISDELIEAKTGVRPKHFAYPWGYWSPAADTVVRSRYTSAVLGGGPPVTGATDPFLLHRIPVQLSDGVGFFKQKVRRGQRSEEFVRRRISRYEGP
jgi:peptidoglycan/xylan/chitin deacetylase (PgdA/CDA1 family)